MALIRLDKFSKVDKNKNSIHKPTITTFTVFEQRGQRIFQIDTYGTAERVMPDKVSQSIQIDETMAKVLVELLQREFSLD